MITIVDIELDAMIGVVYVFHRSRRIVVDCIDPCVLTYDAARGALRVAVIDGRCDVLDEVTIAIANGYEVL